MGHPSTFYTSLVTLEQFSTAVPSIHAPQNIVCITAADTRCEAPCISHKSMIRTSPCITMVPGVDPSPLSRLFWRTGSSCILSLIDWISSCILCHAVLVDATFENDLRNHCSVFSQPGMQPLQCNCQFQHGLPPQLVTNLL